jgi:hypothetical protein
MMAEKEKEASGSEVAIGCLVAFAVVFLLAIGALVIMIDKRDHEIKILKAEAVQRGYAEWVPDAEGNVTFTWKEVK